jgi:hypothetical protein
MCCELVEGYKCIFFSKEDKNPASPIVNMHQQLGRGISSMSVLCFSSCRLGVYYTLFVVVCSFPWLGGIEVMKASEGNGGFAVNSFIRSLGSYIHSLLNLSPVSVSLAINYQISNGDLNQFSAIPNTPSERTFHTLKTFPNIII